MLGYNSGRKIFTHAEIFAEIFTDKDVSLLRRIQLFDQDTVLSLQLFDQDTVL